MFLVRFKKVHINKNIIKFINYYLRAKTFFYFCNNRSNYANKFYQKKGNFLFDAKNMS